jgi:hypothetical protein
LSRDVACRVDGIAGCALKRARARAGSVERDEARIPFISIRGKAQPQPWQGLGKPRAPRVSGRFLLLSVELLYFLFSFFVKVVLLTELTAIQFRAEPGTIRRRRIHRSKCDLISADSWLQLGLEIA